MGGGEVFVCRLDDNDSNFYLDGSPADLTGQEGDVMVVFLEFWYKWYKVDDNKFLYHFADHNIDGTYIHVPQSLVGAYKGYVSSNRLYSWSDVTPTTNVSLSDFRSYAKARGTGFQVIDFQQHCVIAMMLYAKYKTRNLQGVLGPGGALRLPLVSDWRRGVYGCGLRCVGHGFELRFSSCFPRNHIRIGSKAIQKITRIIISYFNCF